MTVSKQHNHAVDPDTQTRCRRQTVLQRDNIVFVIEHRFVITSVFLADLLSKTFCLIFRIVQLGETVTDFATADKEFKAVSNKRIVVITARQRRDFCRIFNDECRLDQMAFCHFLEDFTLYAAQTP